MDTNEEKLERTYDRMSDESTDWFEILAGPGAVMLRLHVRIGPGHPDVPEGTVIKPEIVMDYDAACELAAAVIGGAAEAYRKEMDG